MGNFKAEKLRQKYLETEEVEVGYWETGRLGNWKVERLRQGDLERARERERAGKLKNW